MEKRYVILLAIFTVYAVAAPKSYAAEKLKVSKKLLDDSIVETWAKSEHSSEHHQILNSLTGNWFYTLKFWMPGDPNPHMSAGAIKNDLILGGRFLSSKTSVALNVGGQTLPYEGTGLIGYDDIKDSYVFVWADTIRTGIMNGEGKYNQETKEIEEKGHAVWSTPILESTL